MNRRERMRIEGLLSDWGAWVRQGRTWPNTLGYPRKTMEARVMSNEIGGRSGGVQSRVPRRTVWDERIVKIDRVCSRMPDEMRGVAQARYVDHLSVREIAAKAQQSKTAVEKRCCEVIAWVGGAMT